MGKIILKNRSTGAGSTALSVGEVALAYDEGRLYYRNAAGTVKSFADKTYVDSELSSKADASHTHPISEVDYLQGELDDIDGRIQVTEQHVASTSNPHSVDAAQVGLSNVNNTSDADKPVSTAQQAALDDKADLDAGNLTADANKAAWLAAQGAPQRARAGVRFNGVDGYASLRSTFRFEAGTSILLDLDFPSFATVNSARALFGANSAYNWAELRDGNFLIRDSGGSFCGLTFTSGIEEGKRLCLLIVYDADGDTIRLYSNGEQVGSASASSFGYVDIDYFGRGYIPSEYFEAKYHYIAAYNFALPATTTDGVVGVRERYITGQWVQPEERATPDTNVIGSNLPDNGDLEGGTTSGWIISGSAFGESGSLSINSSSPISGSYDLLVENTSIGTSKVYPRFYLLFPRTAQIGELYRVRLTTKLVSGSCDITQIVIGAFGGDSDNNFISSPISLSGTQTWEYETTIGDTASHANRLYWILDGTNTFSFQLDDVEIYRLGAVLDLPMDEGYGPQLHDRSANRNHALLSETGWTHLLPTDDGYIEDHHLDANGADAYLLESGRDILPEDAVVTSVVVKNNDTANAAAGNFDVQLTDGSSAFNLASNASTTNAGDYQHLEPQYAYQDPSWRRIKVLNNSDAGMDDFNIRVDYKRLKP